MENIPEQFSPLTTFAPPPSPAKSAGGTASYQDLLTYWQQVLDGHQSESGRKQVAVEIAHNLSELLRELALQTDRVIEREERLEQMAAAWDATKAELAQAQQSLADAMERAIRAEYFNERTELQLKNPHVLHTMALRHCTPEQLAHLGGENRTAELNELATLRAQLQDLTAQLSARSQECAQLKQKRDGLRKKIATQRNQYNWQLESDSIIASCGCLTKTNEVSYHKPGCKYRLICERNDALNKLVALASPASSPRSGAELALKAKAVADEFLDSGAYQEPVFVQEREQIVALIMQHFAPLAEPAQAGRTDTERLDAAMSQPSTPQEEKP